MKRVMIFAVLMILLSNVTEAQSVSQWRSTDRKGIFDEKGLLKKWPESGPREIWSINTIGNGFVSPVFSGDRFYISGEIDTVTWLFCHNLKGEEIWRTRLGKEWMRSYPGSRTAATVVDDLIYIGTGMGDLFCLKKNDGKIVWSKELIKDMGGKLPLHGHSEAPLIDGDRIFWMAGGKVKNVIALDRFSGKLIWSNKGFGEDPGYNSPKLIKHNGLSILVTFSSYHLMGFDAGTGQMLWSHEQVNTPLENRKPGYGDTHCNTVLYEDGAIFYAAGDGNGGVRLNLSGDGRKITQVWRNPRFDSYMGGIVKIGKFIYGCGTAVPDLRAINSETGILTDSLKIGTGALIAAEDMLYYYNQKGELYLIKQNNGKMEMVSSFRISKGNRQHFSHPVIYRGMLYQRHGNVLMAFDIRNLSTYRYESSGTTR
jgi:outer membrane protein assembly factor BamB